MIEGEALRIEDIDNLFKELSENTSSKNIEMTDEQFARWKERGVAIFDTRLVFTMESKERVFKAIDTDDFSELNPYEMIALNMMSRQKEG